MKRILKLNTEFYKILHVNSILLIIFNSLVLCSQIKECFKCVAYIDQDFACKWSPYLGCVRSKESEYTWWKVFDACIEDKYSQELQTKYCLSTKPSSKFSSGIFSINKVDNYFGFDGLYCKFSYSGVFYEDTLIFNFKSLVNYLQINISVEYRMNDGSTYSADLKYFNETLSVKNATNFNFHYYSNKKYIETPFEIKMENHRNTSLTFLYPLLIPYVVIMLSFIFLIYKCRKIKVKQNKQTQKTQKNNQQTIMEEKSKKLFELFLKELIPTIYSGKRDEFKMGCTICQTLNFDEGIQVVQLDCLHLYHHMCLKGYLERNILNPKCPNCNYNILEKKIIIENSDRVLINPNPIISQKTMIRDVDIAPPVVNENITHDISPNNLSYVNDHSRVNIKGD